MRMPPPHRLYLNIQSPVVKTIWEGSRDVTLWEEMCLLLCFVVVDPDVSSQLFLHLLPWTLTLQTLKPNEMYFLFLVMVFCHSSRKGTKTASISRLCSFFYPFSVWSSYLLRAVHICCFLCLKLLPLGFSLQTCCYLDPSPMSLLLSL